MSSISSTAALRGIAGTSGSSSPESAARDEADVSDVTWQDVKAGRPWGRMAHGEKPDLRSAHDEPVLFGYI